METKLTLKLENSVIKRAKGYAKKRKTSLSKLVENYLESVSSPPKDEIKITPIVKSLSGIIKLPPGFDYKKEYGAHLWKKYGK
jgi:macrodomain Ter protein organizer (MatP/YcbG family)